VEFIFKDEAFKFETLRAAGFAGDAGADIGEVIATTSQIVEGDEQGWTDAWRATAERTAERGENSLAVGDTTSAREAFLQRIQQAELLHRGQCGTVPHLHRT